MRNNIQYPTSLRKSYDSAGKEYLSLKDTNAEPRNTQNARKGKMYLKKNISFSGATGINFDLKLLSVDKPTRNIQ